MDQKQQLLYNSLRWPLLVVGLLWLIHITCWLTGVDLGAWGIYPRQLFGLRGILTAPFIHGDFSHLLSNSIPLIVLWTLIRFFYARVANWAVVMIYLFTGLAVWLFARSVFHIGASGVVYGMVAFLLGNGLFRRNIKSIGIALVILFFYSGMFLGLSPNQEGISWESHLLGALVGLFTAYYYKEQIEQDEKETPNSWELESEEGQHYFLPRDTFEKTKAERAREQAERLANGWTSTSTWGDMQEGEQR